MGKLEKEAKEAAAKVKLEKEAKEAAEKAKKEKEVKEEAERAKKARDADQLRTLFQQIDLDGNGVLNFEEFQRAFQEAGGLGDISTAKEVLETAKVKKQAEDDEEATARAEREKVKDHFPERKRSQKEEEKVVIKPANLSSRGKRVQEEDITMEEEDMSYQEQGDKFVEDKDSKVQDVVRHLLQEVKITINLKTLKHHIDHIFMIRLGTMLKAGTLTFDKYVRIKNNDRRIMKVLIGLTTAKGYVENDDVFGTLDKALKSAKVDGTSKDRDNDAAQKQVRELLRQTRVPVSEKDFVYHMNKIITIILGMMLHVGVLTFTKFHQMKCTHRADMEDMVTTAYDPNADVFGVLERAIEKQHQASAPMQRHKAPEPKRPERRRAPEDDMTQRQGQMLDQGWDPNDRPEDHSMAKLGRILDSRGTLNSQLFEGPSVRSVQDQTIEDQRAAAWVQPLPLVPEDPVAIIKQMKEKEPKEAAEKARKEKEAKEAAAKAKQEQEAKEAAERAQREKEAIEAAEKYRKEKEKETAEKARKEKEAK